MSSWKLLYELLCIYKGHTYRVAPLILHNLSMNETQHHHQSHNNNNCSRVTTSPQIHSPPPGEIPSCQTTWRISTGNWLDCIPHLSCSEEIITSKRLKRLKKMNNSSTIPKRGEDLRANCCHQEWRDIQVITGKDTYTVRPQPGTTAGEENRNCHWWIAGGSA